MQMFFGVDGFQRCGWHIDSVDKYVQFAKYVNGEGITLFHLCVSFLLLLISFFYLLFLMHNHFCCIIIIRIINRVILHSRHQKTPLITRITIKLIKKELIIIIINNSPHGLQGANGTRARVLHPLHDSLVGRC